jgi:murein DD-endopeptidase MepM/ murein hydrolase activator NlpD
MPNGRHRRKNDNKLKNTITISAALAVGGVVAPVTLSGTANAATVDQWDRIAQCESNGLWNRPDGDGGRSSGGLQFQPASWNDALAYLRSKGVDTSGYPQGSGHQAYKATKRQQIIAGEALLALQGPAAWACNSMVGYPLQSRSSSMFLGGPNPYPSSTPSPDPKPVDPAPSAKTYTVRAGDYLVKIAADQNVAGGWEKLYALNKSVIGPNPNIISVGMKLKLEVADPYASGLPKVNQKSPSAKALQQELKRTGFMSSSVAAADNYGPLTQAAVAKFHDANPSMKSVQGVDRQIGPMGWKLLRGMGASSAPTKPPTPAPPATPSASYVLPVRGSIGQGLIISGGCISRSCGGHSGLDITARQGTPVLSVASGVVVSRNSSGSAYGNHVVVKHADGRYTLYAHLSAITASVGQSVKAGQQIGNVGSTGNSSGPHLHFEVRTHPTNFSVGVFLNPVTYLRSHGVSI